MVREISLTQGYVALVDDEDFDRVSAYKWHVRKVKKPNTVQTYAARNVSRWDGSGRGDCLFLHHFILGIRSSVDHRDRDGLNNQRSNLRPATRSQNGANRVRPSGALSKFRGVAASPPGRAKPWRAQIKAHGRNRNLGYFFNEEDAARAYDRAALIAFGDFAQLNFPAEGDRDVAA